MSSAQLLPTTIPGPTTTGRSTRQKLNTYTRPASFYDKHLAETLVLKRVKLLDSLVDDLAGTVDKTIQDAYKKGLKLPLELGMLHTQERIKTHTAFTTMRLLREDGVAEHY
jgi:hypothetical protein